MSDEANIKPLGVKNYGSIPHLPESRAGKGDYFINPGQARILTEKTRDKRDLVIVQEKLDGSNVGVAKDKLGRVIPITRSGRRASSSPYHQHYEFHQWALSQHSRFGQLLAPGERVVGEWLAQVHGTRYDLHPFIDSPFVVIDIFDEFNERIRYVDLMTRLTNTKFVSAPLLHSGPALSVDAALKKLGEHGYLKAIDPAEGVVYRVERNGKVDFLAKYVRPEFVPGKYLAGVNPDVNYEMWNSARDRERHIPYEIGSSVLYNNTELNETPV